MSDSPFLPRVVSRARLLFGVIGVVIATLLSTVSAAAQDTPTEQEKERDAQVRIGIYFSGPGFITKIFGGPLFTNIEEPEDDVMPYPAVFWSIRHNKYEATLGWARDNHTREYWHNEHIIKFAARYNYYPAEKILYIFGGPVIWHFEKHSSLEKYVCTGDIIGELTGEERCDGETIPVAVRTERPDAKSTTLGINAGFGIEYTLFNLLVFSHEIEFYRSACKRKDFICKGADLKLLGLHLEF